MEVLSGMDIKKGKKVQGKGSSVFTQPFQFLLRKQKDEEWIAHNIDWGEMQGLKQIKQNGWKFVKNYDLANGIIDKTDYVPTEDNEYRDVLDIMAYEPTSSYDLKFYPIIPNIINVLSGEFAKRNDKMTYHAVDDFSYNDMLEQKQNMIEDYLIKFGEQKMQEKISKMGIDENSQEGQQQMQQMMQPENIKSLPEIEEFFKKDYRSMYEEWASHQHHVDTERFRIKELENIAYRDLLVTDKEFWHFVMGEDDYSIEIWNPVLTFYHKSPETRYVSEAQWVGRIDLMTLSDVVDKYGWKMKEEQLESLEMIYTAKSMNYILPGVANDGGMYDTTKSHEWNVEGRGLGMRQYNTFNDMFGIHQGDALQQIFNSVGDMVDYNNMSMLRVTTYYWKTQRMLGELTKIGNDGILVKEIVDEDYMSTIPAIYDTKILKEKNERTLIYGEHINWIWINETWGCIKIGPNRMSYYGNKDNGHDFAPIYLDGGPIPFQFKGDFTKYGCKLPVEGVVHNERNTHSTSVVEKLKPFQILYNLVCNQIQDILIDENGTVVAFDQNALPQKSLGEDWGKGNYAKAFVAMKNFSMLPMDSSIFNTENAINMNHLQVLNLEQTQRLMSRIQLATFFKQQCFESLGFSPQRMGDINSQETATGIEQAKINSYNQTEMLFVTHCDNLMPRVHQMRTDLAQYYHSTNPSLRLQYMTSMDEKINFAINGTQLLGRDINCYGSTKINHREIMEQMKQLMMQNNTSGASIFDLGNVLKSESLAETTRIMKSIEEKNDKMRQEQMQHEKEMQEQEIEARQKEEQTKMQLELEMQKRQLENNIIVAQQRAAVGMGTQDINKNEVNDYMEFTKQVNEQRRHDDNLQLAKEQQQNQQLLQDRELALKQKQLDVRERIENKKLQIAETNRNKYDRPVKK